MGGGRDNLGCEVLMTSWDDQSVCLASFGYKCLCHEGTELLSARGKAEDAEAVPVEEVWRQQHFAPQGTDRELSQLEQVFQSKLNLLLFIPVSSTAPRWDGHPHIPSLDGR